MRRRIVVVGTRHVAPRHSAPGTSHQALGTRHKAHARSTKHQAQRHRTKHHARGTRHDDKVCHARTPPAALVVVLLAVAGAHAQTRRPIRETDLLDFVWTADPQIAPDGKAVAFVRVTVDRERDTYASSIWVVPADGGAPRAMTGGRRDTTPRWSPDGRRLGFLRVVESEGRPRGGAGVRAVARGRRAHGADVDAGRRDDV